MIVLYIVGVIVWICCGVFAALLGNYYFTYDCKKDISLSSLDDSDIGLIFLGTVSLILIVIFIICDIIKNKYLTSYFEKLSIFNQIFQSISNYKFFKAKKENEENES